MPKSTLVLVLVGSLAALARPARAGSQDMAVTDPSGAMHIRLTVPLVPNVDETTAITRGRIEIAPVDGFDLPTAGPAAKKFVLTAASLRFADFRVDRSPFTNRFHQQVAVQTVEAVPFTAVSAGGSVYEFSIPTSEFRVYGAALVNGSLEAGYDRPAQPVTGSIDIDNGTFSAHIVVPRNEKIEILGIEHDVTGTLTVDVSGAIAFPDADHDGVRDSRDNCRLVANSDQGPVTSPALTPPADVVHASCLGVAVGAATAADVCNGGPVAVTNDAPLTFGPGTTVVTWRAVDALGRATTARQNVTVIDATRPTFVSVPPAVTVDACGPVGLGLPVTHDDCDFGAPVATNDAPAAFPPGSTLVTWTATDRAGNRSTATQLVTVNDHTPPAFTFVPPDVTVTTCVAAPIGRAAATDACGAVVTSDAPVQFPIARTTVVTWTARDAVGNVTTATQRVTAELADDPSCCPAATRLVLGTAGRDTLMGTQGRDCIVARGGDDVIDARGGDDFVSGGAGRDTINLGFGNDVVYGGPEDDVLEGGPGDDRIDGGSGTDVCAGATGANVILRCEVKSGG